MKILMTVDPEIPVPPKSYGGIERIVEMLIQQFLQKGHEVTLCANPASKVPCRLVGWSGGISQNKLDVFKNTFQLTRLVLTNNFDLVHSFSRLAYMTALMPTSLPKIMSYQREPTLSQVKKAVLLSKKNSIVFTGCSNYISRQISTVAQACTIYNCAPIKSYQLKEEVCEDAPLIFLGRIEPIKGTHIAVQVALKTKRKLIIAGNIPAGYETYFEEKIEPFLSGRIQYVGPVNDIQKNELLGKCLALLMPITWNEPFGIVMAEAMACGTPVLGFNRGSVPEVVEVGRSGFISSSEDEMVAQVALCSGLDRAGIRRVAEERFSDTVISNAYLSLYSQMLDKKNGKDN
ncbi:MAG: glycosyltransferase family 4 protein [Chitinophagaceae bacterium]|nr:MAG: glycosyltransferase family 4 protein [Chitinophagaceae bacterium]